MHKNLYNINKYYKHTLVCVAWGGSHLLRHNCFADGLMMALHSVNTRDRNKQNIFVFTSKLLQAFSHNEMSWAIVLTRAQSILGTSHTTLNCVQGDYVCLNQTAHEAITVLM